MKILPLILFNLIFACVCASQSNHITPESDNLAEYRDTLIGKFNGIDVDTLIAEPFGEIDSIYYFNWRVFTKNNTVRPLILEKKTIGVKLVYEGDLDGNGTDEWGYVSEWPTSNWMVYNAFTNKHGKWKHIIDPTDIWLPHLDAEDSSYEIDKEDILQPSGKDGFLKVKFSDVRNDACDFLIIDTLIQLKR